MSIYRIATKENILGAIGHIHLYGSKTRNTAFYAFGDMPVVLFNKHRLLEPKQPLDLNVCPISCNCDIKSPIGLDQYSSLFHYDREMIDFKRILEVFKKHQTITCMTDDQVISTGGVGTLIQSELFNTLVINPNHRLVFDNFNTFVKDVDYERDSSLTKRLTYDLVELFMSSDRKITHNNITELDQPTLDFLQKIRGKPFKVDEICLRIDDRDNYINVCLHRTGELVHSASIESSLIGDHVFKNLIQCFSHGRILETETGFIFFPKIENQAMLREADELRIYNNLIDQLRLIKGLPDPPI